MGKEQKMRFWFVLIVIGLFGLPAIAFGKTSLKDQVALITGASGDIGYHTTKRFLEKGGYVVAHYNTNASRFDELREQYPDHLKLISADFTDQKNVERLWNEAVGWRNRMDIIVNCAGIAKEAKALEETPSVMMETMAVNYHSPALLDLYAVEYFRQQKTPAAIINVGSRAARRGMPEGRYHYADSKAALTLHTQQIARDNVANGITAVVIAPGPVEGEMLNRLSPDNQAKSLASMPAGKPVSLEEVVNMIYFIATGRAPNVTGGVIGLTGGSSFY